MYIIYKKNIHLVPSKVAHETAKLAVRMGLTTEDKLVVLGVSTKKFNELLKEHPEATISHDLNDTSISICAGVVGPLRIKI